MAAAVLAAGKGAAAEAGDVAVGAADTGQPQRRRVEFVVGTLGIYASFIQYGRMQERIFAYRSPTGARFDSVWFLQLVEAVCNLVVARVCQLLHPSESRAELPSRHLALAGLGQLVGKYSFAKSLAVGLSFSLATLGKSAKMVPVMLGSLMLGGQRFTAGQVARMALIVAGTSLVTFSEGRSKAGGINTAKGITYLLAALVCDGIVGGIERRMKGDARAAGKEESPFDMMFGTQYYMALGALLASASRNELSRGRDFCSANPAITRAIVKGSACAAFGHVFIYFLIARFDTVVCTAVTTTRKLASVMLSLVEGGKVGELSATGLVGLSLASVGILCEIA